MVRRVFRTVVVLVAIAILAGLSYLLLAPVPIEPVAWQAPPAPGYAGPHARNTRLARLHSVRIGGEVGPEGMALGPDGRIYATVASGAILRSNADGSGFEKWADTGGRVLGLDFDGAGRLIAADAMRGLLAIGPDRKIQLLADVVDGDPIRYTNSVAVARNGRIYFTDSTQRFGAKAVGGTFLGSILDVMEHSATGRLLEFDPATRRTRVVMRDLCYANGVALSQDERSLFVVETCEYRVWKVDPTASGLSAKAAVAGTPQAKPLLTNLPGYPDNLTRGRGGRIWLGLVKPRGAAVDKLAGSPFLRKVVMRLPMALWPVPPAYGHVLAFDESGRIVADLQDPGGAYPETTGVLETGERLWIQSLHANRVAWLPRIAAGLK